MGHVFHYVRIISIILPQFIKQHQVITRLFTTLKLADRVPGRLSNGTNISNVNFTKDGSKIICLPISETILDTALGQHSNISSIWPVSISDGNKALGAFGNLNHIG